MMFRVHVLGLLHLFCSTAVWTWGVVHLLRCIWCYICIDWYRFTVAAHRIGGCFPNLCVIPTNKPQCQSLSNKLDMLIYCTLQMHVQQATYANELHVRDFSILLDMFVVVYCLTCLLFDHTCSNYWMRLSRIWRILQFEEFGLSG